MAVTKSLLLGTTAAVGLCLIGSALPGSPEAAEVTPGGALNISISGFARFNAHGGDLDNARLDENVGTGLDFSNDTEVHVILEGQDDATGLEYGGTVEFEADTNREGNTDETYVFMSGGFGEVRLGDEDGVADNSSVGGQTIAAGTGGIDGTVVDSIATGVVFLTNSNDATKIRYYTPSFGGVTLAASYTPNQSSLGSGSDNGDDVAVTTVEAGDIFEGGVIYEGEFGGFAVTSSIVGLYGEVKDDSFGGEDFWGIQGGVSIDVFGFKLAGSVAREEVGNAEKDFATAGIGLSLGPVNTSVSAGYVFNSDELTATSTSRGGDEATVELDNPYNIVVSADVGLMPGLVLAGDVGYFHNDVDGADAFTDDDGVQGIASLRLAF